MFYYISFCTSAKGKCLGVHFEHEDGSKTFWVWDVLCLGLRDAAHFFAKVLNPLMEDL